MKTTLPRTNRNNPGYRNPAKKHSNRQEGNRVCDERARQLADIAASGDEDASECAAADLCREFPPLP